MITQLSPATLRRFRNIKKTFRARRYGIGLFRDDSGREFAAIAELVPAPKSETSGLGFIYLPLAEINPDLRLSKVTWTGICCITSGSVGHFGLGI